MDQSLIEKKRVVARCRQKKWRLTLDEWEMLAKLCRVLGRFRSVQCLTQLAHDKNNIHLDLQALKLNQLIKWYEAMNNMSMPDEMERARMMNDTYQKESEGGKYPL